MKFRLALVAFFLVSQLAPSAQAFELGVEGGFNLSSYSQTPAPTLSLSGNLAPTFGAFFGVGLNPLIDVEIAALMATRKFGGTFPIIGEYSITGKGLVIPVLARFNLLPIFSFGVGPYYSMVMGDLDIKSGTTASTKTYAANSASKTEFGLELNARIQVPIVPMFKLLADVRYNFGLTNGSTATGTTTKYKDLMLLAGASFSF